MRDKFSIETSETKTEYKIRVVGFLDEHCAFPSIPGAKTLRVDLGAVTHINSIGVQIWCKWLKEQSKRPQILLENCPFIVTKYFSAVQDVLAPNVKVESFFVPYFSNDEQKNVLFRHADEAVSHHFAYFPVIFDSNGNEMQMDVFPDVYFQFLKR